MYTFPPRCRPHSAYLIHWMYGVWTYFTCSCCGFYSCLKFHNCTSAQSFILLALRVEICGNRLTFKHSSNADRKLASESKYLQRIHLSQCGIDDNCSVFLLLLFIDRFFEIIPLYCWKQRTQLRSNFVCVHIGWQKKKLCISIDTKAAKW